MQNKLTLLKTNLRLRMAALKEDLFADEREGVTTKIEVEDDCNFASPTNARHHNFRSINHLTLPTPVGDTYS